jgi:transposase-like protein
MGGAMARAYTRHDWTKLDPLINRLIHEEGYTVEQACQDLGIKPSTYRMHQRTQESGTPEAHQSTPLQEASDQEHLGTPESADITEGRQSIPEQTAS